MLLDAASEGSVEIVQCLVNKGVALNKKNSDGKTPLMMAVRNSHIEVAALLINSGADIHCCDNRSWTALHHASLRSSLEVVKCLVDKGVSINRMDSTGKTPYHFVNRMDSNGKTPLHIGIKRHEIADCLLKAGADCNFKCNGGTTPFNFIMWDEKYAETLKLCIENGACVLYSEYKKLFENPLLKKVILGDVKLCSQAVINVFNNRDLPLLYFRFSSQKLPHIDKMKIRNGSQMALEIEQAVRKEIEANGFCNLLHMVPPVLGILCVKSLNRRLREISIEKPGGNPKMGIKRFDLMFNS